MALSFFWIPARYPEAAQRELNQFLRTNRVLAVEKHFHAESADPGWSVAVDSVDAADPAPPLEGGKSIDYREVLDAETFSVFSAMRTVRKELAVSAGVPPYVVFSNAQLAEMAQKRIALLEDLKRIKGVGPAQIEKYGASFLDALARKDAPMVTDPGASK